MNYYDPITRDRTYIARAKFQFMDFVGWREYQLRHEPGRSRETLMDAGNNACQLVMEQGIMLVDGRGGEHKIEANGLLLSDVKAMLVKLFIVDDADAAA